MRFIVYGAGGIGSVVGGHLARTGHDVLLIARPAHAVAINERGLQLETPAGSHVVRLPAVTGPDEVMFRPGDIVLLTMKSQHTEPALHALKACVDQVPIFCLQNGVRNEEAAAALFEVVYGVTVRIGAVLLHPGAVKARMAPPGWLIMGRYPAGTDILLDDVAAGLREAGLIVRGTPEIMRYKWGKVMTNVGNAVGAITDAVPADCLSTVAAARAELRALLEEARIDHVTDAEIAAAWPEFAIKAPNYAIGEPQSSTWQSLARRQGSVENEYFNGEVVRLARSLGRPAPINDGLNRIVQEMARNREVPGKHSLHALRALLGLIH